MQWIINICEFLFFEWILSGNVILSPVNESVVLDGWSGKKKNVLATIDYGEDQKGHLRLFIDKFKQQLTEPTDIETTTPPVDEITGNSFAAAAAGKIPSWAALEYVLLGFLFRWAYYEYCFILYTLGDGSFLDVDSPIRFLPTSTKEVLRNIKKTGKINKNQSLHVLSSCSTKSEICNDFIPQKCYF